MNQSTLIIELKRSSRTIISPQRYSSSLNDILLTDRGELESYKEVAQVDKSFKWELAIKDEMDSLMSNQTWQLVELSKEKRLCKINGYTE